MQILTKIQQSEVRIYDFNISFLKLLTYSMEQSPS
jgi:hypothetical protein